LFNKVLIKDLLAILICHDKLLFFYHWQPLLRRRSRNWRAGWVPAPRLPARRRLPFQTSIRQVPCVTYRH